MKKGGLLILRLFKNPVQWIGVDYLQFETLIITKLSMDFRNSPAGIQTMGNKKNTLVNQLFMYLIFGCLFGIAAFSIGDLAFSLTIFFSVILVSLTMTLISEFTTVLFDPRDNQILLPRPVNNRTLLMFRIVHIQVYMGLIALALSVPASIMIIFKYSLSAALVFLIAVGLCSWISLVLTTFFYLMLSKIVNGERFKDIISYAQIIMVVIVFGSYQLIPHLMDIGELKNAALQVSWWTYFFPPAWLAAFVKICCLGERTFPFLLLALPGIIVPAAGVIILVRFVSKGFGNILSEDTAERSVRQSNVKLKTRFGSGLYNLFCITENEIAGWKLTLSTVKRDRKFKQSVYPNFGMIIVLAIVLLKPDLTNLIGSLQENDEFRKYFFIVILGFSMNNAILQLPYTDTPEAAWIYRALPFNAYGEIITGSVKAMLIKFLIPIYVIITIPSLMLWGFPFVAQILLSVLCNILLVQLIVLFQDTVLPFTRIREMQQKGTNSLRAFFSMIMLLVISGLIYSTKFIPFWSTILICGIITFFIVLIFRQIRKRKFRFS